MTLDLSRMGFGITGSVDHDVVQKLAPLLESAGFRTLWFNHAGSGNALASMQVAASVTSTLRLGSGVVPVDRVPAEDIVREVRDRELPLDRCIIGIGASAPPSPLSTARRATQTLHEELDATVFIGALGPRMRRLAVTEAEGELLNWLTPDAARLAVQEKVADLAQGGASQDARVALYIRVALGSDARPVLEREAARYASIPSYAANFQRLGITSMEAAVVGEDPVQIREGLDRYTGIVDETVVRAITANDTLDQFSALVNAVAG